MAINDEELKQRLKEQMNAADAQLRNAKRLIEETNVKAPIDSKVSS